MSQLSNLHVTLIAHIYTYTMSYTYTCTIVPGQSCSEILLAAPECRGQSGQFWIENATAQAVEVYCDMVALGGGWERVALFDASNSLQCPGTLNPHAFNGTTLCSNSGVTAEVRFIPTAPFSEMRGTVSAYVAGDLEAFLPYLSPFLQLDINGHFMDGVAVMLDDQSGHLKFVHAFGIGRLENVAIKLDTTCPSYGAKPPISIIGSNYACALLRSQDLISSADPHAYGDLNSEICNTLPNTCVSPSSWFHRQLPNNYYPGEVEIILRVLSESPSEILLKYFSLYTR